MLRNTSVIKNLSLFFTFFFAVFQTQAQREYNAVWSGAARNLSEKKYTEAITGFSVIIHDMKIFSDSVFYARASAYFDLGDMHKAIADAGRCVSINKNHHQAYFLIGLIKSKSENYSGAIRAYNRAIKLSPNVPKYYFDRGVAYLREEDIDDALLDFEKVIQLQPDYAHAYFSRGYCKDLMGKTDAAIADMRRSIELDKTYKRAYLELALIHIRRKESKEACEVMNAGIKNGCEIPEDMMKKYCQ